MKKIFLPVMMLAALATASCGSTASTTAGEGEGETIESTAATGTPAGVEGSYRIENVVMNDTLYAIPAEETPGELSYITFAGDGNYSIKTNCNTMMGTYTLSGDTLTMGGGASTRMACPNMKVEDLLGMVLPLINNVEVQNDSVVRLGSDSAACIMLVRAEEVEAEE